MQANFVSATSPSSGCSVEEEDGQKYSKTDRKIVKKSMLEDSGHGINAVIRGYVKCGALTKARRVFDQLSVHSVVSWTILIGAYAQCGNGEVALKCLERMRLESLFPDSVTLACAMKACGSIGATGKGQKIHMEILGNGLIEKSNNMGGTLICMYAKCGQVEKAKEVFDRLVVKNVVSWTALIMGYTQCGYNEEALRCFDQMQLDGPPPNALTFSCILKTCGKLGAGKKGEEIHGSIADQCLLGNNRILGNALVGMYAKCGSLEKAREVFCELPDRNIVSWTSLIGGHAQHGNFEEALDCFEQMRQVGFSPNSVTYLCILKACGKGSFSRKGLEIHDMIIKEGLLEKDIVVGSALTDMYINSGMVEEARETFDKYRVQDVVLWNTLITGYAKRGMLKNAQEVFYESPVLDTISWNGLIDGCIQHGYVEEAIKLFDQMQLEGFCPDTVTFACVSRACGDVGLACKGQKVHAEIVKAGLDIKDMVLRDALIDMYSNCGMLAEAHDVFESLASHDMVLWSVLMAGYTQLGEDEIVFHLLNAMLEEGNHPDPTTVSILLNACSHSGLVDKGQMYFERMFTHYALVPSVENWVCLVDLLGRAGQLDRMVAFMENMPLFGNLTMWHSILGSCRKWGNLELGRFAFLHAVQLDQNNASAYVSLQNIFGTVKMQEDVDDIFGF